jgi:pimeloyl-ACP methyl ester carboxylesterase
VWVADLGLGYLQLRLEVEAAGELSGFVDDLAEGVSDLALAGTVDGAEVSFEVDAIGSRFTGSLEGDRLEGTWRQGGIERPLAFERRAEPLVLVRPQQPEAPFPYTATEVEVPAEGFSLAATIVVPDGEGPFPGVVLVSGSGPQDRDESIAGHKPFLVLADGLARAGIASLRYDDRGVGGSGGRFETATTADLAADAAAAVTAFASRPEIDRVGIVGHSEGGLIGPLVATGPTSLDFVVSLAGPGLPGRDVLLRQAEDQMRAEGFSPEVLDWRLGWTADVLELAASDRTDAEAKRGISAVVGAAIGDAPAGAGVGPGDTVDGLPVNVLAETFASPWMRWFLRHDPAPVLEQVQVPVLVVVGELDLQVSASENIPAIEAALAGNPDATVVEVAELNHLFQHAETGAVSEYDDITETFAPEVIELMAGWIGGLA